MCVCQCLLSVYSTVYISYSCYRQCMHYGELISLRALFVGVTALFVGVKRVQHVMRAYNFIDST